MFQTLKFKLEVIKNVILTGENESALFIRTTHLPDGRADSMVFNFSDSELDITSMGRKKGKFCDENDPECDTSVKVLSLKKPTI